MNILSQLVNWSYGFLESSSRLTDFLNTSVFDTFTLLSLVSIGGLLTYLGIAVTKWLIS